MSDLATQLADAEASFATASRERDDQSADEASRKKIATEIEAMKRDAEGLESLVNDDKAEFSRREQYVNSFPTETQLLKLDRRLETLKSSIADAQRSTNQAKTGIDAYTVRCDACRTARKDLGGAMEDAVAKADEAVTQKSTEEQKVKSPNDILSFIDELVAICEDRESRLLELNQSYADKLQEEGKLNEQIVELQRSVESELPRLEAEADRIISELTAAWSDEKIALQATYDKLYSVNKEQQFHLLRGTHVKREGSATDLNHENALSARQARLSTQLLEAKARLHDLQTENSYVKKITDQLRSEGRQSLTRFDAQKEEVGSRLREAREERQAAETEARNFRNLKADLQGALQSIRETPSGAAKTN